MSPVAAKWGLGFVNPVDKLIYCIVVHFDRPVTEEAAVQTALLQIPKGEVTIIRGGLKYSVFGFSALGSLASVKEFTNKLETRLLSLRAKAVL